MVDLKHSALPRAFSDVVSDIADLIQKEIHLAKTEVSAKIATKLRAGGWMAVAGVFALFALIVLIEAAIFGISSHFKIQLWASSLIVAGVLVVIAGAAFAMGKADAAEDMTPDRTIRQLQKDVATAKETTT